MLDYEEELKNFQEVPEIEEVKLTIYETDVADLTDIMQRVIDSQQPDKQYEMRI